MDFGVWTENSRSTYNKWDGVARSTTQVIVVFHLSFFVFITLLKSLRFTEEKKLDLVGSLLLVGD